MTPIPRLIRAVHEASNIATSFYIHRLRVYCSRARSPAADFDRGHRWDLRVDSSVFCRADLPMIL